MPSAALKQKIREALFLAQPFDGTCTRITDTKWARKGQGLSSEGSRLWGGRYNPKGKFGALYLTCARETCLAEVGYSYRKKGIPLEELSPPDLKTEIEVEVKLSRVLDLTDLTIQQFLSLREEDLKAEWESLQDEGQEVFTQVLADLAREAGWEALLVPSARHTGHNLVVISIDNLDAASSVQAKAQKTLNLNELAPWMNS